MTDPIADMIIRIKNAHMARHDQVVLPHSKIKAAIAKILLDNQYIEGLETTDKKPQPDLVLSLKYVQGSAAISGVRRLSKPGRRLYASAKKLPKTLSGYGLTIVSTSKGVMIGKEAKKQSLGGELLCQVW